MVKIETIERRAGLLQRVERAGTKGGALRVDIEDGDGNAAGGEPIGMRGAKLNQRVPAVGRGTAGDVDELQRPPVVAIDLRDAVRQHPRDVLKTDAGHERGK